MLNVTFLYCNKKPACEGGFSYNYEAKYGFIPRFTGSKTPTSRFSEKQGREVRVLYKWRMKKKYLWKFYVIPLCMDNMYPHLKVLKSED